MITIKKYLVWLRGRHLKMIAAIAALVYFAMCCLILVFMSDNELIAEFMKLDKHPNNQRAYWIEDQDCYLTFDNLQFHKSWNQLMPVVQRIYKLYDDFNFISVAQENMFLHVLDNPIKYPIHVIYKDIVEFIKWYNQQKS